MRTICNGLLALVLCILATPTLAQARKSLRVTRADAEYNALMKGFNDAMQKFDEPLKKAKTFEEHTKIETEELKYGSRIYLPRFQALARRAYGSEAAAKALNEVVVCAFYLNNRKAGVSAADSLVANYMKSPSMELTASMIGYASGQLGVPTAEQMLHKIVDRCPNRTSKAAAIFSLASMYNERAGVTDAQKAEAKSLFVKLTTDYSDTPYAKQAAGAIFRLENLEIGMIAPDFEATDEAGKNFKLSDYRGKVVVLDFWGFW